MKKCLTILILIMGSFLLNASVKSECQAIKSWLGTPFSSSVIEAERDTKISKLNSPVKGEFETTTQFEQSRKENLNQISLIRSEYEQKISDARDIHEAYLNLLKKQLANLLSQSQETIVMKGTLGAYDADR